MAGKYSIIYADPPWFYRDSAKAGKRGSVHKYPLLKDKDLQQLPVKQIAAKNSVLFLWSTFPVLREALDLMASWGFRYVTIAFVWVKTAKNAFKNVVERYKHSHPLSLTDSCHNELSVFWGMGNWTRANVEICMLGTRGKIKRKDAGVHQLIFHPRMRHSRKPDEVRQRIIKLMGRRKRIELFATEQVKGWDAIGLEIDGRDIRKSLPELVDIK
jgi:N6-adenosine-specific RNA methylase IME4